VLFRCWDDPMWILFKFNPISRDSKTFALIQALIYAFEKSVQTYVTENWFTIFLFLFLSEKF
jgi:hypothetical protein